MGWMRCLLVDCHSQNSKPLLTKPAYQKDSSGDGIPQNQELSVLPSPQSIWSPISVSCWSWRKPSLQPAVSAERSFSTMNRVKTPKRARLSDERTGDLTLLSHEKELYHLLFECNSMVSVNNICICHTPQAQSRSQWTGKLLPSNSR